MGIPASTSLSYAIAKGFAVKSANYDPLKSKTIFKIFLSELGHHEVADVSWISPFPGEREIIFKGSGNAFLEPELGTKSFEITDERFFFKHLGRFCYISEFEHQLPTQPEPEDETNTMQQLHHVIFKVLKLFL